MSDSASRSCSTCSAAGGPDDFYKDSTECKPCKRGRSRQNRQLNAQKIILADRLLDIVGNLAVEGWLRELVFATHGRGPVSDSTAARPLIESQETRS